MELGASIFDSCPGPFTGNQGGGTIRNPTQKNPLANVTPRWKVVQEGTLLRPSQNGKDARGDGLHVVPFGRSADFKPWSLQALSLIYMKINKSLYSNTKWASDPSIYDAVQLKSYALYKWSINLKPASVKCIYWTHPIHLQAQPIVRVNNPVVNVSNWTCPKFLFRLFHVSFKGPIPKILHTCHLALQYSIHWAMFRSSSGKCKHDIW